MANFAANSYGLSTLCPIKNKANGEGSYSGEVVNILDSLKVNEQSPFAAVPNTYLARLFVLNDVYYEDSPATLENLKSKYLVFTSNFYTTKDDPTDYLVGMWQGATEQVQLIWQYCVGFDKVNSAADFAEYIKKCQVTTSLFFNGSIQYDDKGQAAENDVPLDEQLKGLYLKQEFGQFVADHQGIPADQLQQAFQGFMQRVEPSNFASPTWAPGKSSL